MPGGAHNIWTLHGAWLWIAMILALAASGALLAVLHLAPNQVKRQATVALTFLCGLFYFVEFFVPPQAGTDRTILLGWNLTNTSQIIGNATQVVAGFTFLLGIFNLVRLHGNLIRRRREGWGASLAFFASLALMTFASFARDWKTWFGYPQKLPPWIWDRATAHSLLPHDLYTLLFETLRHMESTMFSILAFYIVSAAYRAFRIRSAEAAVLMIVALVLMMGQVPLGMALTSWIPYGKSLWGLDWSLLRIENFSQYVLSQSSTAVLRAILLGLGLGMLAMGLRIWLSLERGAYFGAED